MKSASCVVARLLLVVAILCLFQNNSSALHMPPLQTTSDGEAAAAAAAAAKQWHTSDYRARQNHPTSYDESPRFKGPIQLLVNDNDTGRTSKTSSSRVRIRHYFEQQRQHLEEGYYVVPSAPPKPLQESAGTLHKLRIIVDHLVYADAPVDVKEACESIEFLLRTRKRLYGAAAAAAMGSMSDGDPKNGGVIRVYDLCCGHGLTGMLFAACRPGGKLRVESVLVDRTEPPAHVVLRQILAQACPWLVSGGNKDDAISFQQATLESISFDMDTASTDGAGAKVVIWTHACGALTDRALQLAVERNAAAIAVMPCCYTGTDKGTPYGIQRALGLLGPPIFDAHSTCKRMAITLIMQQSRTKSLQ